jgi:hypothetical protein
VTYWAPVKMHLEFSIKSEKYSTRTLSLVQNRLTFLRKLRKSTLAFMGGETQKSTILFCGKLSFILFWPLFPFSWAPPLLLTYIFTSPTCTTTIISLGPCKLNAEFQHSIPRFNKISLRWGPHSKERMGVERTPKSRVTLWRTLFWPPLGSNCQNMAIPEKQIPRNLATLALFF